MISFTLFKRECKGLWKIMLIFGSVLTLYISMIISMYEPEMQKSLDEIVKLMPGIMDALGLAAGSATLSGYISSYLYGFLMIVFPMAFSILSAHKLIAGYVDRGSMASLLAAPVRRSTVAFTQMKVIASGIFTLIFYCSILEIAVSEISFPGKLDIPRILLLNLGLFCLHLFIAGICFFCSCFFSDAKYSIAFGAGIPTVEYIVRMLANTGGSAEKAQYLTFFSLFHPDGIIAGNVGSMGGIVILFFGAVGLFAVSLIVFSKRDLHI